MEPPSYMSSVVDRNVVMRRILVLNSISVLPSVGNGTGKCVGMWRCKTSYTVLTGIGWPGREAHHLPPPSAEIKNEWIYSSIPPYPPSR